MSQTTYTPREGSKAEAALQALLDGPMTTEDLADAMDCEAKSVQGNLSVAMSHGAVVKLDDTAGKMHYALRADADAPGFKPRDSSGASPPPAAPKATPKASPATTTRAKPPTSTRSTPTPAQVRAIATRKPDPLPDGKAIAITHDGAILVIDGDRVAKRLEPNETRAVFTVMQRLAG